MSVTSLKRLCRYYGIKRWPYRQISGISRRVGALEAELEASREVERLGSDMVTPMEAQITEDLNFSGRGFQVRPAASTYIFCFVILFHDKIDVMYNRTALRWWYNNRKYVLATVDVQSRVWVFEAARIDSWMVNKTPLGKSLAKCRLRRQRHLGHHPENISFAILAELRYHVMR